MAINAAYICDTKTDQTVGGKKTFTKEIKAPAFVVKKGPELTSNKDGALLVKGVVSAAGFEGDASRLKNFSVKNMNAADIEPSIAINKGDYLLVQKIVDTDSELKKIKINDVLTLIPSQNGVLFNFINNGSNKGDGAELLKGRSTSGRSQVLNFRTLHGSANINIIQEENAIHVDLNEEISISTLQADEALVVPRLCRHTVESPINGMFVYDEKEHRFYGYAKNRWIPTRHSMAAGPNIELLYGENEIDIKLKDQIQVETVSAQKILIAPRRNIDEIKDPDEGSIVYDSVSERFYGFSGKGWASLQQS
jgi:hypothetical protein